MRVSGPGFDDDVETTAKVIETTPEKWLEGYRRWSASNDLALAQDDGGVYYFTTLDGVYNEAPGVTVPNHILNQPWSVAVEEFDNGAMEMEGTYYKIDDTGYLYEAPWED